ncbi:hypothetical protein GIB67_009511 [Kingdonia uniflora]|uniref:Retrotransposon gag domain-containing protein n=1 Tax=Kingdonia uniflora TaxID=39325 RepID=A0A7J7NWD7_9MAGN|nr:hypothetical protein GIB67_009511 [Kingdonia uniflora]
MEFSSLGDLIQLLLTAKQEGKFVFGKNKRFPSRRKKPVAWKILSHHKDNHKRGYGSGNTTEGENQRFLGPQKHNRFKKGSDSEEDYQDYILTFLKRREDPESVLIMITFKESLLFYPCMTKVEWDLRPLLCSSIFPIFGKRCTQIYKGLNDGNDFKHCEAYKILAREPRWANLRDDGLNHEVNIPRNIARRTSDYSSPGNLVGSNNLSEDPDGPPTPQSAGSNFDIDGSLYEGGSRPIGQKLHIMNIASQKAMEGVTASGSSIHALLDELQLEKMQTKEENERRRTKAIQHWQTKMHLEQAKEDRKIMEKDLSTLSGHQLQYYLQRQAEIMECLANRGGPGNKPNFYKLKDTAGDDLVKRRFRPKVCWFHQFLFTPDSDWGNTQARTKNTARINMSQTDGTNGPEPIIPRNGPEPATAERITLRNRMHPTIVSKPSCIVIPRNVGNFELKPGFLSMLPKFHGSPTENPYNHLRNFRDHMLLLSFERITEDSLKLRVFPFSLLGNARDWLYTLEEISVNTFEQLVKKFLKKYFPNHRTAKIRQSLDYDTRARVQSMCAGTFDEKTNTEAWTFLNDVADKTYQWKMMREEIPSHRANVHQVDSNSESATLRSILEKIENLETSKRERHPNTLSVNHVAMPNCVVCESSDHLVQDCPDMLSLREG